MQRPDCSAWIVHSVLVLILWAGYFPGVWAQTAPVAQLQIPPSQEAIYTRSWVEPGDTARLCRVLAKARRGEPVTIGVIGGSISEGGGASAEENRWAWRVAAWWRAAFPKAKIEFVNASLGATGSAIGVHRAQEDLLRFHPDFVVAEFAVNDQNQAVDAETMEGLARQILMQPNQPALMLLFTMWKDGGNSQQFHSLVGRHYGLPMISLRDALWPEIQSGRMKWEDVESDQVHPNDRGHQFMANFVIHFLERILMALPPDVSTPTISPLPAPLISDLFEHTALYTPGSIVPVKNSGWHPGQVALGKRFNPSWQASKPGSVLEFDVQGTAFHIVYNVDKGKFGMAEARVDDQPPVKLNGWFSETWGGYSAYALLGRGLAPGQHKVKIRLLKEKARGSKGHIFNVQAIMAAGVPPTR